MATKAENFIHIRFEHPAAVECKRDILATEMDLLRMNKRLRTYIESRIEELELKADLNRKLRSVKLDLGRLQNLMPGIKIPKLLKETHHEREERPLRNVPVEEVEEKAEKETQRSVEEETKINEIDAELQDIQSKLDALA
jgi:hypothetical protein